MVVLQGIYNLLPRQHYCRKEINVTFLDVNRLHFAFNSQFLCRHSEEMIEKLESAGLGFYVRATKTQQKLGECVYKWLLVIFHWWLFDQSSHCREHSSTTAGLPCAGPTPKHATTGLWLWSAKPWDRKGLHKADCVWSCEWSICSCSYVDVTCCRSAVMFQWHRILGYRMGTLQK